MHARQKHSMKMRSAHRMGITLLAVGLLWGCTRAGQDLPSYSYCPPPSPAPRASADSSSRSLPWTVVEPDIATPGMESYHPGQTVTIMNDRAFQEWKRQEAEANKPKPLQVQLVGADGKPIEALFDKWVTR